MCVWWWWWWWSRRDVFDTFVTICHNSPAPNDGGSCPCGHDPKAPTSEPLILANTAQGALSPAIPALYMSLQGKSAKLSFWAYRP